MKKIIDNVFDIIIKENGLSKQRLMLIAIKDALFINLKKYDLARNQKFDFSFSFAELNKRAIRFSYNNFEEKKEFPQKLKNVFSLFGNKFDVGKLDELLEKTNAISEKFQTTIGLEWEQDKPLPRFKIYFEELFNLYSAHERNVLLNKIINCIGFDKLIIKKSDNIGAIAVDFLPEGIYDLKVYDFYSIVSRPQLNKSLQNFGIKSSNALFDAFYNKLCYEKKAFNYITYRIGDNKLKSIKLYKIYEAQQINNFRTAFGEIANLLKETYTKNKVEIRGIAKICHKHNLTLYPVIISVDFSSLGRYKFDLYLSIR